MDWGLDSLCEDAGLKALSRTPAIVALVVLLLSVVVLVAITLIQIHQKEILLPGPKYGIVLDAGSSRTTVYVYQWPAEKENNTGVVSQTCKCSVKGSGISSYSRNPQDAPEAFEDCMQKVKEQIPAHLYRSTRIYLGATAGMRLLRLQNETAANEVLASIQNYFKSQPFDFRGAQIISGQEEGIYGWITANYLMGNFLEKDLWHMWVHPKGVETTGALDLGGASTQISFAVGEEVELNTSDVMKVSLYGYVYTLYTRSFQCYGRNEAEKRFLATLLQAFAGFYYTASALNLSGSFSLNTFNSSTWNFCSQNWSQLQLLLPRFDEMYARSYCFSAHYIYHLLVENSSIAWSLGYMLSLTNQIPAEVPLIRLPMKPPAFMGTLAFFTGVALLCLGFLVYLYVLSRNQRHSRHALDHAVDSE
ncbi:Ectonucleoside triphosphate diphosphohydrolase 3 [Pteropus alecto]|uniref:Ectonucleoside triphosphate diphosphohydrolase 3 n=1 Tax=Pteropus alecto TaxID=9402 RepID=L5KH50_PTEAL|nr:Ectonucleoside triphosphate diphosphohydrolase 3 [Pteropus alecto]